MGKIHFDGESKIKAFLRERDFMSHWQFALWPCAV